MEKKNKSGSVKALEAIAVELRGIKHFLAAIYREKYLDGGRDGNQIADILTEELITVEEASKRLNVAEQTIRNWIVKGTSDPAKGWVQGVHFIYLPQTPRANKSASVRILWNAVVKRLVPNSELSAELLIPYVKKATTRATQYRTPDPSVPNDGIL